jgi:hypothetical protein
MGRCTTDYRSFLRVDMLAIIAVAECRDEVRRCDGAEQWELIVLTALDSRCVAGSGKVAEISRSVRS